MTIWWPRHRYAILDIATEADYRSSMDRRVSRSLALVACVLLHGCIQYNVGKRSFRNKADALTAHQSELAATLAAVTATESPVGGTIRIVLPSDTRIAESGLVKHGDPSSDAIDYVVTTTSRDLETMAAAVKKRQLFREVAVERSSSIGDPSPGGADFILWFYQPAPSAYQWYVSDPSTKLRREVPLDLSKPAGPERVNTWLAALERITRKLKSKE